MGNCAAKKRAQRLRAEMERQAALERAGLADAEGAGSDAAGALSSGYGGGYGGYGYVHEEECPEGIDEDLALLLTAAAIAAGAFIVFRQITIQQGRKKRSDDGMRLDDGFTASLLLGNSIHSFNRV